MVVLGLATLLVIAAGTLTILSQRLSAPSAVSGQLSYTGSIQASYSSGINESYSPACGCARKLESVRGISLVSRRLTLWATPSESFFYFMSPLPGLTATSPQLRFDATLYRFRARTANDGTFYAKVLPADLANDRVNPTELLERIEVKGATFAIARGADSITLDMVGEFPFLVWNPTRNAAVELSTADGATVQRLVETAGAEASSSAGDVVHPTLDALANVLVVASAKLSKLQIDTDTVLSRNSDAEALAIVIRPAFSMRIVPIAYSSLTKTDASPPARLTDTDFENNITTLLTRRRPSLYQLTAEVSSDLRNNYATLRRLSSTSVLRTIYTDSKRRDGLMQFVYPEVPDDYGFAIWGNQTYVELKAAQGSLLLDSQNTPLGGPATLRLEGVGGAAPQYGTVALSPDGPTRFRTKAASVTVNGELAYTYWDKFTKEIAAASFVLALIGLAIPFFTRHSAREA